MADTVKWGILSTAKHGQGAMIPAIKESSNGEVTAICSRNIETAQKVADEFGIPKAYGSYEELLADPGIDAVYNPLPTSLHADWAIKCAEAGKACLTEKPMALNAGEVEKMIQAFKDKDLLLSESLMFRYHPLIRKIRDLINEGGIGDVKSVYSQFNVMLSDDPNNIRYRKETGGGSLLDVGCYCVSVLRMMAGEEPSEVKAVADISENGIDTGLTGVMKFPSGAVGHFGSHLTVQFDCWCGASGTKGKVLADWGAMCAWPGEEFILKYWHGDEYEEISTPAGNAYTLIVEDFGKALLEKREMQHVSLEDTQNNMKAIDALLESAGL